MDCHFMPCHVMSCRVVSCRVVSCSVLFCSVLFCSVPFRSVLSCPVLFCYVLFCSVLFCSVLFCSVLFCSVLFCSVLFCSVLFCSVLFCSVLFGSVLSWGPKYFFLKKSNRRPVVVKIVLLYWKNVSDIEKHCCRPRSRCENCENFENYNMRTTYVVYNRFSVSWDDRKSAPVGFSCWNWFYCFFGLSWGHSMEKCWGSNFSTP